MLPITRSQRVLEYVLLSGDARYIFNPSRQWQLCSLCTVALFVCDSAMQSSRSTLCLLFPCCFLLLPLVGLGMAWGNTAVLASGIRAYIPPGIHEGGSYVAAAPEHVLVVAPKHRPYRCCLQLMLYISVNACHITRSS